MTEQQADTIIELLQMMTGLLQGLSEEVAEHNGGVLFEIKDALLELNEKGERIANVLQEVEEKVGGMAEGVSEIKDELHGLNEKVEGVPSMAQAFDGFTTDGFFTDSFASQLGEKLNEGVKETLGDIATKLDEINESIQAIGGDD